MKNSRNTIAILLLYVIIFLNAIVQVRADDNFQLSDIKAVSAVLIDTKTGATLYDKEPNKKIFPASTTKIMTALLVLEKSENLNEKIKMSHEAIYSVEPGSSHIAMNEGETLTIEQALYGLLVASANEVANALSEYVSGNTADFCKLMNKRAKELGCTNTNFVNPHGFHNENHFTSAHDLALIMREAIKHPDFLKIISTVRYEIPPTEKQPETRVLYNTNKMIQHGNFYNKDIVGGKTGFTNEAGHTLVSLAQNGEKKIICVVTGEENFDAYTDTSGLIKFGFEQFNDLTLLDRESCQKNCTVSQRYKDKILDVDTVNIYPESDIKVNIPKTITKNDLHIKTKLPENIYTPVDKTKAIGSVIVNYKGISIAEFQLYPEESMERIPLKEIKKLYHKKLFNKVLFIGVKILSYLALLLSAITVLMMFIRKINTMKKKRRKRKHYKR